MRRRNGCQETLSAPRHDDDQDLDEDEEPRPGDALEPGTSLARARGGAVRGSGGKKAGKACHGVIRSRTAPLLQGAGTRNRAGAPGPGDRAAPRRGPTTAPSPHALVIGARRSMRRLVVVAPSTVNSTRATVDRPDPSKPTTVPSP